MIFSLKNQPIAQFAVKNKINRFLTVATVCGLCVFVNEVRAGEVCDKVAKRVEAEMERVMTEQMNQVDAFCTSAKVYMLSEWATLECVNKDPEFTSGQRDQLKQQAAEMRQNIKTNLENIRNLSSDGSADACDLSELRWTGSDLVDSGG